MKLSQIHRLIIKFIGKEAHEVELEELDAWLTEPRNITIFNDLVRIHYYTANCMAKYDLDKAKESIRQKVRDSKRKRRLGLYKQISMAASVLLLMGLVIHIVSKKMEGPQVPNEMVVGSGKPVLTLGNGDQVVLENGISFQKGTINGDGEQLIYSNSKANGTGAGKKMYNDISVPRGRAFFVKLSDGTKVWLNAETKLKYPVMFHEGQPREVELLYGEAYFEVVSSTSYGGSDFNVLSNGQKINVLGTEFNVSAYLDDEEIVTTLVGGRVSLEKGKAKKILNPNQQSRTHRNLDGITIHDVDAAQAISWVNGVFTFDDDSLDAIMKVFSRWYDVEIVFESAKRKDFSFTGVLERTMSLDEILGLIEMAGQGEVKFEIKGKTVHIK